MITGVVNQQIQAILPILVQDAVGRTHPLEAMVDTGYNGFLTLPHVLVAAFGLPWISKQTGQLADGSHQSLDVHGAVVIWDGQPRAVEIEVCEISPLLGTGFLKGHELRIKAIAGGSVTIEALP